MQLKKEQIAFIDNYLKKKGVNYWDVKLEILDHLIIDIEQKMKFESIDFNKAFKTIIKEWKSHLKPSSSLITGIAHSRPKIIIQKMTKIFSRWFVLYSFFGILPLFLNKNTFTIIGEDLYKFQFFITFSILAIIVSTNILLLYWFFRIDKKSIKSTYRFLFNSQSFSALILTPFLFSELFYQDGVFFLEPWIISFIGLQLLATLFGYQMFKKHQNLVKNIRFL